MSGVMLLEHIGERAIADRVTRAIWDVLGKGETLTGDLGGNANTKTFTDALIDAL
jgi:isocitrate dehydrogenase (NAD+)